MTELVKFIVTELVEDKESVVVNETESGIIHISVAKRDMGKVIGKQGRTIKSIRTVVKAAATKTGAKYTVELLETAE